MVPEASSEADNVLRTIGTLSKVDPVVVPALEIKEPVQLLIGEMELEQSVSLLEGQEDALAWAVVLIVNINRQCGLIGGGENRDGIGGSRHCRVQMGGVVEEKREREKERKSEKTTRSMSVPNDTSE
jgi:hypothetical protein